MTWSVGPVTVNSITTVRQCVHSNLSFSKRAIDWQGTPSVLLIMLIMVCIVPVQAYSFHKVHTEGMIRANSLIMHCTAVFCIPHSHTLSSCYPFSCKTAAIDHVHITLVSP